MSSSEPTPTLLGIPAEVRVNIYHQLFADPLSREIEQVPLLINLPREPRASELPENYFATLEEVEDSQQDSTELTDRIHSRKQPHFRIHLVDQYRPAEQRRALITLQSLTKTCQKLRGEFMPSLGNLCRITAQGVKAACWFAITQPDMARHVQTLELYLDDVPLLEEDTESVSASSSSPEGQRQRWLAQVLRLFPNLALFKVYGIHRHQDPSIHGTKYMRCDLRLMQFVLDNSHMEVVAERDFRNFSGLDCNPHSCDPTLAFGVQNGFLNRLRHSFYTYTTVDVQAEMASSDQALIQTNVTPQL